MGELVEVGSLEAWTTHMAEANSSKNLYIAYAHACRLCSFHKPVKTVKNHSKVAFCPVLKVEGCKLDGFSIAEEFGVEAMPTFLFMKEGKVVDQLVGASEYLLEKKMKQHTTA
ncbi:hypothetical protein VPH35_070685 [Triticum aestivum]